MGSAGESSGTSSSASESARADSRAVYRCEQPLLGREAVVKVLHQRLRASEVVLQRFMREARLASRLDHPYAAHVYAFGVEPDDGLVWIAMEMVHGTSLERWLRERGPLPLDAVRPVLRARRRGRADRARPRDRASRSEAVERHGDRARGAPPPQAARLRDREAGRRRRAARARRSPALPPSRSTRTRRCPLPPGQREPEPDPGERDARLAAVHVARAVVRSAVGRPALGPLLPRA